MKLLFFVNKRGDQVDNSSGSGAKQGKQLNKKLDLSVVSFYIIEFDLKFEKFE